MAKEPNFESDDFTPQKPPVSEFTEFVFKTIPELVREKKLAADDPIVKFSFRFRDDREWPMFANNQKSDFREYLMRRTWNKYFPAAIREYDGLLQAGMGGELSDLLLGRVELFMDEVSAQSYVFNLVWADFEKQTASAASTK